MRLTIFILSRTFFLLAFTISVHTAFSQSPSIIWEKKYGNFSEISRDVAIAPDGTTLIVGQSGSNGGDVSGHHGSIDSLDGWVVKLDTSGNMLWQKSIGGSGNDFFNTILSASDSGYLCIGSSKSNDGDLAGNTTRYGAWLVKLSANGDVLWSKTYGGSYSANCFTGTVMDDGNIALIVKDHEFREDYSVIKLDSSGNVIWRSQGNELTGKYIAETQEHNLLTSSGLVFDAATGDTSRFAGFPDDGTSLSVQALKRLNNRIYIALKNWNDGINKVGYFDSASVSFIFKPWIQDVTYPDGQSVTYSAAYNGLGIFNDSSFIIAGNSVASTRGGVFTRPLLYALQQSYIQPGSDDYGQFNSIKAFPSGNKIISCLWAFYENKFWIIKYQANPAPGRVVATWTGANGTSWHDPGNWSTNAFPDDQTIVVIPANVPNYPVVTDLAACYSLKVDSNATFTINPGVIFEIIGK